MNEFFGKARRRNGAGTMTKEKQSQRSHSSGILMDHVVLFHIPQQRSIVSSVLRSGIMCPLRSAQSIPPLSHKNAHTKKSPNLAPAVVPVVPVVRGAVVAMLVVFVMIVAVVFTDCVANRSDRQGSDHRSARINRLHRPPMRIIGGGTTAQSQGQHHGRSNKKGFGYRFHLSESKPKMTSLHRLLRRSPLVFIQILSIFSLTSPCVATSR